ncbi:MAG: hypothetical protein IJV63_00675 [Bacteroidales bacterium]|nr:hypothetical protein [Bacteroidales bacterium]
MMRKTLIFLLAALCAVSCFKDPNFDPISGNSGSSSPSPRVPTEETRHVLLMVSAGYNSLSSYLTDDLEDLSSGTLPLANRQADVLLVLSRLPQNRLSTTTAPVLYRMYANKSGEVVRDTLRTWGTSTPICTPDLLNETLTFIKDEFPAKGYGMVFSSHASGWIPQLEAKSETKTVGQDKQGSASFEIDMEEFAAAIPYRMDYILFDACFMACVEVAWELRGKADIVGFSPAEVLAEGFVYKTLTQRLLQKEPDPVAVCRDYFEQYDPVSGHATITVVDTRKMDRLATVCKRLFEEYREGIFGLIWSDVQYYFRPSFAYASDVKHLFDIQDILVQAGVSAEDKADFDAALKECILYEAHTPQFLSVPLTRACGLSMYLPTSGTYELTKYYAQHTAWNKATELVVLK